MTDEKDFERSLEHPKFTAPLKNRLQSPLTDRLQGKKSNAKRIGVKSVLAHGDKRLAITRCGQGNSAEIVFDEPNGGRDAVMPSKNDAFTIRFVNEEIGFQGGLSRDELEAMLHNPTEALGQDKLGLKAAFEKEFFGKEFPGSNVHIQLAHNILDIQKILGLYINDVLFTINNLQTSGDANNLYDRCDLTEDVLSVSFNKEVLPRLRPYMAFFGDAFKIPKKKRSDNSGQEKSLSQDDCDTYNLNVLKTLSAMRRWTAHWGVTERHNMRRKYPFFNANKSGNKLLEGTGAKWSVVEDNYQTKIDRINKGFRDNSKLNVKILYRILRLHNESDKKDLVQDYYDFSILKQGKNLGVNITKLRENIIDKFYPELRDKICDPHRSKIHTIADYVIYRKLKASPEIVAQTVSRLQYAANENQKVHVYKNLASSLWTQLEDVLEPFFKEMHCESPRCVRDKSTDDIPQAWIDSVMIKANNGIPFVMLLSLLCNFLEGKQINELLTAYIHKFENIQSFIDTLAQLGEPVEFVETYSAFNSMDNQFAKNVASQLRILASIGKMNPDMNEAKKQLYIAAIQTLGATDDQVSDAFIEKHVLPDKSKENYETIKKSANPFRNFIANNVIESRRFQYLVRYSKPKTVRAMMNNAAIVRYALSRLPEKQIDAYYERTTSAHPNAKMDEKLDVLARTVTGLTFQTVFDNKLGIVRDPKNKPEEVERLKAQINLYLTVAYVAIKQLVKINARYFIAYQIFERDLQVMQTKVDDESTKLLSKHFIEFKDEKGKEYQTKYFGLINYFLEQDENLFNEVGKWKSSDKATWYAHVNETKKLRHFFPEWHRHLKNEVKESLEISDTGFLPTAVRNITEHLAVLSYIHEFVDLFHKNVSSVPMTSYFELYHFLMQSRLHQVKGLNLDKYSKDNQNGVVDSRLVHIAYVPLGYNLARYKNLTIEALFDEDGVKGQNFVANKCYKQTFNRIAAAKRRGKPDSVIEALKKDFIDQYGSEEEAQKAVRQGELWSYQDEARECGLKSKPFPEMIIRMMKFRKFTEAEIDEVKRLYEVAKRKTQQNR